MTVKPGWTRKRDRLQRREEDAARASTAERPWALSATEWRLLAITFVGGLGSIIVGACVIGGAIAIARWMTPHPKPDVLGHLAGLTGAVLLALLISLWILRRVLRPGFLRPLALPVGQFATGAALIFIVLLLAWIGLAAGVH
jgi:hypothetical protein